MREQFLRHADVQFVHNKCHDYGWAENYLFELAGQSIGYASVWGLHDRNERDTLFEFYLIPQELRLMERAAELFFKNVNVRYIECQTNMALQTQVLFRFARNINAESVLFTDANKTKLTIENCVFRQRIDSDPKNRDDDGPYILLHNDSLVAYGGLMYNYNAPYADVYMHVVDGNRQQGFGGLFVQELKRLAYEQNKVPAARC
ncbi:MAG: N-acetyltransferase, partial [Chitinophagaceae bacterium]|nr:N-acetyltransferase [Chitinophagaceae bacterium]